MRDLWGKKRTKIFLLSSIFMEYLYFYTINTSKLNLSLLEEEEEKKKKKNTKNQI